MTWRITQNIYNLCEKRLRPWSRKRVGQRRPWESYENWTASRRNQCDFNTWACVCIQHCPSAYYWRSAVQLVWNAKQWRTLPFPHGTTIPAGCIVAVPVNCIYADSVRLSRPCLPICYIYWRRHITRTLKLSTAFGSSRRVNKMETASRTGHGRHAWYVSSSFWIRGRVWSSSQPWTVLRRKRSEGYPCSHSYDVRYRKNGRPGNLYFEEAVLCDTSAEMLFRKRNDVTGWIEVYRRWCIKMIDRSAKTLWPGLRASNKAFAPYIASFVPNICDKIATIWEYMYVSRNV